MKKKYEFQFLANKMLNNEIERKSKRKKNNPSLSKPTNQLYNLVVRPKLIHESKLNKIIKLNSQMNQVLKMRNKKKNNKTFKKSNVKKRHESILVNSLNP
jgi:hypothetical protein